MTRQYSTIVIAKNRNQQFIPEFSFERLPIDIEVRSVGTRWPILEHIPPVLIVSAGNRHVIGDDIQHLSEPHLPEPLAEARMSVRSPEFLIHAVVVHYVIAMQAAGRRLQIGRRINMGDAEFAQIIRYRGCSVEIKARM